jgi:hypothetical protein
VHVTSPRVRLPRMQSNIRPGNAAVHVAASSRSSGGAALRLWLLRATDALTFARRPAPAPASCLPSGEEDRFTGCMCTSKFTHGFVISQQVLTRQCTYGCLTYQPLLYRQTRRVPPTFHLGNGSNERNWSRCHGKGVFPGKESQRTGSLLSREKRHSRPLVQPVGSQTRE